MKDPFPDEGWLAHRHATLRAQAGSCTEPPSATPRGLERAQIADLRPPHLETVNLRGATRRPGGEAATRREVRSTRGGR